MSDSAKNALKAWCMLLFFAIGFGSFVWLGHRAGSEIDTAQYRKLSALLAKHPGLRFDIDEAMRDGQVTGAEWQGILQQADNQPRDRAKAHLRAQIMAR